MYGNKEEVRQTSFNTLSIESQKNDEIDASLTRPVTLPVRWHDSCEGIVDVRDTVNQCTH